MDTNKEFTKNLEGSERIKKIKKIKERFGDKESFIMKFTPEKQITMSEIEAAAFGDFPTLQDICLAYGESVAEQWLYPHVIDLGLYANAVHMTKGQYNEIASIIAKECQDLKISEVLNFFYQLKSAQLPITDKLSPWRVILNLRTFLKQRKDMFGNIKKVYMIVENQPKTKVFARVFRTQESAEKALQERDERTGERLYKACHVIERSIE